MDDLVKRLNEARERAKKAKKAFCPDCFMAGMMNCGYFDECGSVEDYHD